jgi:hypothetical protein
VKSLDSGKRLHGKKEFVLVGGSIQRSLFWLGDQFKGVWMLSEAMSKGVQESRNEK